MEGLHETLDFPGIFQLKRIALKPILHHVLVHMILIKKMLQQ